MPLFIDYPHWLTPAVIPGLPLRWYGLMYLVAFATTYAVVRIQLRDQRLSVARRLTDDDVMNLFFWTILGLLIGARVFAALIYDTSGRYLTRPWLIFWPFDENMNFTGLQGMSYHGGLVGSVIAFIAYCKAKKIDVLEMADVAMAAVPLGYTFGRLGNFLNRELYGRITARPWGVRFPNAREVPTSHPAVQEIADQTGIDIAGHASINLPRHPSQLYEAFLEGVLLWAVIWFVFRRRKPFKGFMIGIYVIGYGMARFVAEYFRAPDPGLDFIVQLGPADNPNWLFASVLNITTGQVLSLIMIAAGVVVLLALGVYARSGSTVETYESASPTRAGGQSPTGANAEFHGTREDSRRRKRKKAKRR